VKRSLALVLFAALAVLPSCSSGPTTAATVNGTDITVDEVQQDLEGLAESAAFRDGLAQQGVTLRPGRAVPTSLAAQWLMSLIQQQALADIAERRDVTASDEELAQVEEQLGQDPSFAELPKRLQRRIAESRALQLALSASLPATSTYDTFAADCTSGRIVGHVLTASEESTQAAVDRLQDGEPLATVATEVSTDEGANQQGGLLLCDGSSQWTSLDETFRTAAEQVPTGGVSDPVETEFGWHAIVVLPLTEENAAPLLATVQAPDPLTPLITEYFKNAKITVNTRYGKLDRSNGSISIVPPTPPDVKSRPPTTTPAPADPGVPSPTPAPSGG
jgi:peptidyl-prolyl cis-trans isomerase C